MIELSAIAAAAGRCWDILEAPTTEAAKKVVGKVVADKVGDAVKGVKRRFIALLPLPQNHDLVRGLRADYLTALQKTLRYYKAELDQLPLAERARHSDDVAFFSVVQDWLDARINPVTGKGVDHHKVTASEVEAALNHMVHPSSAEGFAEQMVTARNEAEQRVLVQIGEFWADVPPPRFLRWFKGGGDQPGWYDLFALYVHERIKTDERFRSIFVAAELVDIKRLLKNVDDRIADAKAVVNRTEQTLGLLVDHVASLKGAVESTNSRLDQLMAALDARGITTRAAEEGLARATVLTLAQTARPGEELTLEQAITELTSLVSIAIGLIQEGERGTNGADFVNAVLRRVAEKVKGNDIDGAARELEDELKANLEREEQGRRDRIALLRNAIRVDLLRRDSEAVARRVVDIAKTEYAFDATAQLKLLKEHSEHYHNDGWQRGLNISLEVAIAIAREALQMPIVGEERAAWHLYLGRSLALLGERERGTERLEEAVTHYRAALEKYRRGSQGWGIVQNDLGIALSRLGNWDMGTERLEQGVMAFRSALEVVKHDSRAQTHTNLGATLMALYHRVNRLELLVEGVAAIRAALTIYTREGTPIEWAGAQSNLGSTLTLLGKRQSGTKALEDAATAILAGLEIFSRESWPLEWGNLQYNLGIALLELGVRESGTGRLEAAERAFRAALLERTRDRAPLYWADTQTNLGSTLVQLAQRGTGTELLKEAVTCYRAAVEEYTHGPRRPGWFVAEGGLLNAQALLATRRS